MGGMALHFGWIAEMKTGEGKTLVSTLPVYLNALPGDGRARHHRQRLPGPPGRGVDGADLPVSRADGRARDPRDRRLRQQAQRLRTRTSPTGPTPSWVSTTCATTWPASASTWCSATTSTRSSTRSTRSSSTRPEPRSSSPGPADESTKLYYQFASVVRTLRRDVDYEVDEEKRTVVPTEEGIAKVERQLGVENLYDSVAVNYVHQLEKALQAKELYQRDKDYLVDRRRGEDRRRVHRPDPGGQALVGRAAPGRRGEGARPDPGGEPHLGDGDAAELLPHVREARRNDRHRRDRGGGVRVDLPACTSCRSRRTARWSGSTSRT